ncbi:MULTISPECIES: YnfU family zinc-binding protein [Morganellaceae]|uniref:YnfU family zinc-binding protein n=1 Tax=Morganellaceae TaxID=1903414 RepID=UPI001BCBB8D1|nr:YnfU family zinc-binding protein [Proteus mirabilis]HJF24071.1 YnfU family zinc-binding protein [Proteus mirabilis]
MKAFNVIRMFQGAQVEVTCPSCSYVAKQNKHKLKKNLILLCPNCGYMFYFNKI